LLEAFKLAIKLDNVFVISAGKSRSQEIKDRAKQDQYPGLDKDLQMILDKYTGILNETREDLPTTKSGDAEVLNQSDLDADKEERFRMRSNRSYHIH
jgi:hypothetical protein